jgi:uncharacterized protein
MSAVIAVVTVLILFLGLAVYFVLPKLVFAPVYYDKRDMFHLHPESFKPLQIVRDQNVVLEGIVFTPENPECTVLYFGGKEQDSVALVGKLSERFPSWRIAAFNYRGYGLSQGKPTEHALLEDAVYIADYIKERYGDIVVMGYSLGASVAAFAASRSMVDGLVLVAPFYDIPSLVRTKLPGFPAWLMCCRFETARHLGGVNAPVSIFASTGDTIVPIGQSRALKAMAKNLALYKEYSGYNHAEILGSDAFAADAPKVCR